MFSPATSWNGVQSQVPINNYSMDFQDMNKNSRNHSVWNLRQTQSTLQSPRGDFDMHVQQQNSIHGGSVTKESVLFFFLF